MVYSVVFVFVLFFVVWMLCDHCKGWSHPYVTWGHVSCENGPKTCACFWIKVTHTC